MRNIHKIIIGIIAIAVMVGGYYLLRHPGSLGRNSRVMQWLRNPQANPQWVVPARERCGDAPFIIPTSGFIGFLWDDSFRIGHRHQGIDIFGGEEAGITPVYAASRGYLTRLPEWKSSLIIRIPQDPLYPGRQIYTYYTHLADADGSSFISADFPAGTVEEWVEAGTMLGYQGNYSGDPDQPTGVHLHFSIVLDDGQGKFRNELEIKNTLDPSPYFGLALNAVENLDDIVVCPSGQ
jgi:murein DD-endopeptidase MepM/ murein hydrolase activator NlpD